MTYDPTEKQFLGDVKTHELTVHLDQDTHRHIELSSPGTNSYCFHLLTWPGNLCITGDCGTYTFNRVLLGYESTSNPRQHWAVAGTWCIYIHVFWYKALCTPLAITGP